MQEQLAKYHLILASGSPRRQQFLRELGLDFEIRLKEIDEIYPEELKSYEITNYLAKLKAEVFLSELKENEIVITSDTIVWLNDKALGKPTGYDGAVDMLKQLSGQTHEVFTSVCLSKKNEQVIFFDRTAVTFSEISEEEIHYYLENYQPFDKAGSYGIQDWLGLAHISKIEGSYTNVVGLPTEKFYQELTKFVL